MSYLGRGVDAIDNISTLDNLTFSGSTATYNLTQNSVAFTPVSADALQIQIDGIIQAGNYTVSGSTVTFDFTPSGSSVCNSIKHFGVGLITAVSDGAVTTAKIGTDAVTVDKVNLVSTSSVPSLEAKGDGSSQDGYIQLNCSQNSHGVKIKSPAHSAGQSYTLTLPGTAPAANKIIQTDGSGNLSFVDTPGGGLVYVGGTSSTSEVSALTVDNVFSSTYQNYLIVYGITIINGANGRKLQARVRHGGTTVTGSEYHSVHGFIDTTTSAGGHNMSSTNSNNADRITLGADAMSNSGNLKTCVGTLYCFDMNASNEFKTFVNDTTNLSWGGYYQRGTSGHAYVADQAIDGITFFADSDNLREGYFRVYGIVNS
jgi:hypothetical protein